MVFWWGWLFYPFIFLTRMAKFLFFRLLFSVLLVLYSVPQSFLDWLLLKYSIGIYCWLLWILGVSTQLCLFISSPFWRFSSPLWYFCIFIGGVFLDSSDDSTAVTRSRHKLFSVISALPRSVGIFTGIYSLSGWMTPFLHRCDHCLGSFLSLSSLTSGRVLSVHCGVSSLIFRSCGSIPRGWINELLFLLLYIIVGGSFFVRSIFQILLFRFGWLNCPVKNSSSAVFHTQWDSVSTLSAEQLSLHAFRSDFSPGQQTAIVDNCANTHVWNDESHFIRYSSLSSGAWAVSTIGGKNHYPEGSGDVSVSWRNDNNMLFRHISKNVLFFSDSPVKIISAHKLAAEWGSEVDQEGTLIKTKYAYGVFKWRYKKLRKTIQHPVHGLPEMVINDTNASIFSMFCNYCSSKASQSRAHFCSYAWCDPSVPSFFIPNSLMRYSCDGFTSACRILRTEDVDGVNPRVFFKLKCGCILDTSSKHLQHIVDPDIALVPSKPADFWERLASLSDADLSFLANPQALDPIEKEWLQWHNRLNHLSRNGMIQLVQAGVLPKKFLRFRHSAPFCASCAFGKAHRHQWRYKSTPVRSIWSVQDTSPGAQVSIDQIISAQPGLLAQMSGH